MSQLTDPASIDASNSPAERSIPADLLETFLLEAEERLRSVGLSLPSLAENPKDRELLQEIRRNIHSLKGAAAIVGFSELSRLAHRMEDLLDLLYEDEIELTQERLGLLFDSTDALEDLAAGKIGASQLQSLYAAYEELPATEQNGSPVEPAAMSKSLVPAAAPPAEESAALVNDEAQSALLAILQQQGQYVRIPIGLLDEIVKSVSELIITRASFEQQLAQLTHHLEELRGSSARLGRVATRMEVTYEASTLGGNLLLRNTGNPAAAGAASNPAANLVTGSTYGFDDLEFDRYTEFHLLLRGLTEASGDVHTLDRELTNVRDDFENCFNRQGRLCSEIQDKLMRLRMVPLSALTTRLQRTVRNVAAQRGKLVNLVLDGEDTQLDKTVIDALADPLLHILRNAVDHGIELPIVRQAQGKPQEGRIQLKAAYEGTQIILRITDDGAGLDPERLRKVAIENEFLSSADAPQVSEQDLLSLIFLPGFSTAPEISEISGRGVGLDIAQVAIHRMKGAISVESKPGLGTSFVIRLPMTMAVMQAMMVQAGNETFAIPLTNLKQIVKIGERDIERVGQEQVIRVRGVVHPLLPLTKLLNIKPPANPITTEERAAPALTPALLMDIDGRMVAITVDATLGGREIVVKNLGNHLREVRGISGATLLGNGQVALILNIPELVRDILNPRRHSTTLQSKKPRVISTRKALSIMVVDDSLSVRRVLSGLLSSEGWTPVQAKDGLDALEMIPRLPAPPDLVLLDIEMPRMDGFEFINIMRKQKGYEKMPIVVLTSRAGQKHRDKAFEVGATDYLIKPYQDDVLLGLIRKLTHLPARRQS